jgi:hypothetical protein
LFLHITKKFIFEKPDDVTCNSSFKEEYFNQILHNIFKLKVIMNWFLVFPNFVQMSSEWKILIQKKKKQ